RRRVVGMRASPRGCCWHRWFRVRSGDGAAWVSAGSTTTGPGSPRGCSARVEGLVLLDAVAHPASHGQGEVVGRPGAAHRPAVLDQLGELVVPGLEGGRRGEGQARVPVT